MTEPMRLAHLVVAATVLVAASSSLPSVAHGKCASPSPTIAPHGGSSLPVDPVLYVFMPRWFAKQDASVEVRAGDAPIEHEVSEVSTTDAFVTLRIEVRTNDADRIAVHLRESNRDDPVLLGTYAIDPQWTGPSDRTVEVLSSERVKDRWTCSYNDAQFLTVTDAPAYRVDWTEAGEPKSAVVPHNLHDFFLWGDREPSEESRIGLGHVSCFGRTAAEGDALDPTSIVVTGLWPDGSRPASAPEPLADGEPESCFYAHGYESDQRDEAPRPWLPWTALAGGLLGLLVASRRLIFARRR
jgi:hypothetical protein